MDSEAAIHLGLADGVELEQSLDLGALPVTVRAGLLRLHGAGADEAALSLGVQADVLPVLYFALHRLAKRGLLSYRAVGREGVQATLSGARELLEPRRFSTGPGAARVLSRFAVIRRYGNRLAVESPFSPSRVVLHDRRTIALVAALALPGVVPPELTAVATLLTCCGALTATEPDEGPLAYWSVADLLVYARGRVDFHQGGYGKRERFAEPVAAPKDPMSDTSVELFTPDLERLRRDDVPFTAVLENRRTDRFFGDPPIGVRQLGEFLYRVARRRTGGPPYPGAGGVYELELYLSVAACDGLEPGFYHYHSGQHRLYALPAPPHAVEALLQHATQLPGARPQVLFTIAARFPAMFSAYDSIGYSLILKDVGVLYQTMYLVAEAMGLAACALGGGRSEPFAQASRLDAHAEGAVGEFLLGSRSASAST